MATRRRSRPATASRILAAGVAIGGVGGAVSFMAVNDPSVVVRTVAAAVPPAPPAKVIVLEVQHRAAPVALPATGVTAGSSQAGVRSAGAASGSTGSAPRPSGAPTPTPTPTPTAGAPAPAPAARPAPAPAPAPAPTPAPATKTGPS